MELLWLRPGVHFQRLVDKAPWMTLSSAPGPAPMAAAPAESQSKSVSGLKRVLSNLAHLLGGKVAAGLMSLIYLVIVARTLGARDYGQLVLINGYTLFVGSLIAFSGFHGVVRYGALALEAGDTARLARIVRFMTVVETGFGLLAVAVAAAAIPLVGPHFGLSPDAMRIALPYSLAVLSTVRATPQGLLQVAGRFDLIGIHQAVSPTIRLIGTFIVWGLDGGLDGFLLVWLASSLAEGAMMWVFGLIAWRRIVAGERLVGPWRGLVKDGEGFGRFVLITNFDITLRELAPNLAPLTVGWLLGPAAAGLFSLAQRATSALQQPAILLSQASYAVLADQVAKRRLDMLRHTVWRSAGLALLIAVPFVLFFALAGSGFLPMIGGKSFAGGALLLTLIGIARACGLVASPVAAGLTALGRPQRSMVVTLGTNLLLYPLLPVLILWYGTAGAGWHALVQNGVAMALLFLFFRRDAADGHAPTPR
jgi:O-antigen/teichoic acid export membrane protein